jgi:hypothetical protein
LHITLFSFIVYSHLVHCLIYMLDLDLVVVARHYTTHASKKINVYLSFLLQSYSFSITTVNGFETFLVSLNARSSHERSTGVDFVLSCVDNYGARMVVNQVICQYKEINYCIF